MIRLFRKRDASAPSSGSPARAAMPPRALPLQERISRLPQAEESTLLNRLQALAADPVASEADWARLDADIAAASVRCGEHAARVAEALGSLRGTLDDLRQRVSALGDPDRARWRHWLALTAEAVGSARARSDLAELARLAVEAREHSRSLAGAGAPAPQAAAEPDLVSLRATARRMLDEAEGLVARLPRDEEERARQRLRRLQRLFQELMDLRDPHAARVLMLHLEDARDDILRRAGSRGGPATLADQFPATHSRPSVNPEES